MTDAEKDFLRSAAQLARCVRTVNGLPSQWVAGDASKASRWVKGLIALEAQIAALAAQLSRVLDDTSLQVRDLKFYRYYISRESFSQLFDLLPNVSVVT